MNIVEHKAVSLSTIQDIFPDGGINSEATLVIPELLLVQDEYLPIVATGPNCFTHMTLKEIIFPKNIKTIEWSFYACKNLLNIFVDPNNQHYVDIDGVLFNKDASKLLAFPNARIGEYHIPEGTMSIAHFAFKTTSVTTLHIPSSVKEVGINAFYDCKIKDIHFDDRYDASDIKLGDFKSYSIKKYSNPNCHFGDKIVPLLDLL